VRLEQAGRHEQAADAYREAIRLRPDLAPAGALLDKLLAALGSDGEVARLSARLTRIGSVSPLGRRPSTEGEVENER
jgi:tetratricopeptide (TPR) repeat protein